VFGLFEEESQMTRLLKFSVAAFAVVAFAGCSSMPDWMPGSGSVRVKLSPGEEVPPVKASGSGSGSFRVKDDGSISGSVSTTGVQGTMAHIHQGAKGRNGPVIVPLTKNGDTYSVPEGRKLTEAQMKAWKAGDLYVNVHTNANKGGEVRGQINP
jgi:hypothetical protein